MKKFLSIAMILVLVITVLSGCGAGETAETAPEAEVPAEAAPAEESAEEEAAEARRDSETWDMYVAAGLKKPMDVIAAEFQKETGDTININYSSSGSLFSQIEQGQPCDLFFTADWLYVEKLEELGLVDSSTKFLTDNVAMVVSENAKDKISSIADLAEADVTVAVCDPSAPVGAYTEEGLKNIGIWDEMSDKIVSRPSTVNQAAIMVKEDEVDAAFIFTSVARANGLEPVDIIDQEYTGEIIFATVAVKGGRTELAEEFVKFANEHVDEFVKYGWKAYEEK